MLEVVGLHYQPSTAAQPLLSDIDLRLTAGGAGVISFSTACFEDNYGDRLKQTLN